MAETIAIPQPKTYGPLGNLPLIDKEHPTLSLWKMAEEQGPIFRMKSPASQSIIVSGHELAREVCDETRFAKSIEGALEKVRAFAGDGLFTSWGDEPNWQKAHNILMPTFSQRAMKGYHPMMVDIAQQLLQKWARLNPNEHIDVPEDMTRLTLDTIGLCGFNYRFNSFYRERSHPFIESMGRGLDEAMQQMQRLPFQERFMFATRRQFQRDITTMFSLVDDIIAERKKHGTSDAKDLLSLMLNGKDPETGQKLDDENIRYQIITFLIAGHETTSGLLAFTLYFLLQHPDVLQKAQQEADAILSDTPTYEEVTQLKYIRMILHETLRLWPSAPAFGLYAKEDTVVGGKYEIKKGERVVLLLPRLHRDKEAWGEDADRFRPERFLDYKSIPHHAYKPFGNGQRACIGMQFALHEATLVIGMLLRRFTLGDPTNYTLDIKQTLTIKPNSFFITAAPRVDAPPFMQQEKTTSSQTPQLVVTGKPASLLVLYGSEMGTAEGMAREIAETASQRGIKSTVAPLSAGIDALPTDGAVLIVTSSYNGKPPKNAERFLNWLSTLDETALRGVSFSVFGCGDHNWAATYQAVPRQLEQLLLAKGATVFSMRGEGDVAHDVEQAWQHWKQHMWKDACETFDLKVEETDVPSVAALEVEWVTHEKTLPLLDHYGAFKASVIKNDELQRGHERSTRHLELLLPAHVSYHAGDHIGILPSNSVDLIQRVIKRFALAPSAYVKLQASSSLATHLPLGETVAIEDVLRNCVELQDTATPSQIELLAAHTNCPPHAQQLRALATGDSYQQDIVKKHISMLDLLDRYEACELPFSLFLGSLKPLRPRFYSISSAPTVCKGRVSITVAVVSGKAYGGDYEYRGVASNDLAQKAKGDEVYAFMPSPNTAFHYPEDPATPLIMVGPGTGLAPFRGFLQHRAFLQQQGIALGPAHLYFGCRNEEDYLYREELAAYNEQQLVTLHTVFSRTGNTDVKYVQHVMTQHAEELLGLLQQGAKLCVCGDGTHMARDVEATLLSLYETQYQTSHEEAQQWLTSLQQAERYVKDVWSN
ncbi:cytochrome P450 family protein [Fictibacillus macauensis ZFHKF-1]|uniref:Bifunctional cytochrome P450/NADPH--P450 reductase n=1 Tax=Fictibacillus macauensis ZFHKF-1 TaxID=1196324 RepID=I8AFG7_9BACL|nr:cytochrome P450 [Fictibacillus macauensis]EIT84377.1 cytochrome P450 family protein [Fictibacillus macauensis ZFHKF-1]